MHRYNNQDHSMLTARHAAEAILADCSGGPDGQGSRDSSDGRDARVGPNSRDALNARGGPNGPSGPTGPASKRAIWEVNIDDDYHEQVATRADQPGG